MRRALEITTTTHRFALVAYATIAWQAVLFITGSSSVRKLTEQIGEAWTATWALAMLGGSLVALGSAALPALRQMRDADTMTLLLRAEAVGALTIGLCSGIYLASLIGGFGLGYSSQTQTYAAGFAVAGLARAWQAWRESRKLAAAARAPEAADPPPLAEAPATEGG